MSVEDLLRLIGSRLDDAGIPFMLTGSVAAAFHGAGRATMDIDLVIEATEPQLAELVESLSGPDIHVSADAALKALRHESTFKCGQRYRLEGRLDHPEGPSVQPGGVRASGGLPVRGDPAVGWAEPTDRA